MSMFLDPRQTQISERSLRGFQTHAIACGVLGSLCLLQYALVELGALPAVSCCSALEHVSIVASASSSYRCCILSVLTCLVGFFPLAPDMLVLRFLSIVKSARVDQSQTFGSTFLSTRPTSRAAVYPSFIPYASYSTGGDTVCNELIGAQVVVVTRMAGCIYA
ncbi:hypothetical protein ABW21_db0202415 [Orbilia brochopaga]|nr:hypothetical protein ABW21_db0202415 [Drechslerella brochopaga]